MLDEAHGDFEPTQVAVVAIVVDAHCKLLC
jgi:hypothetical protein